LTRKNRGHVTSTGLPFSKKTPCNLTIIPAVVSFLTQWLSHNTIPFPNQLKDISIPVKENSESKPQSDELLWEKWAVFGDEEAFFRIMDRYKRWIVAGAYKKIVNSFDAGGAVLESHEFFYWCQSAPQLRRRLIKFNPEKGVKLTTYFSYIIRSCWSIYFKRHLYETIIKKHREKNVGDGQMPGILESRPSPAPLQDKILGQKQLIVKIKEMAKELASSDSYLIETEHFLAFGRKYSDKSAGYIKEQLGLEFQDHEKKVEEFHLSNQTKELHLFMAESLGISTGALHVRFFRAKKRLVEVLARAGVV